MLVRLSKEFDPHIEMARKDYFKGNSSNPKLFKSTFTKKNTFIHFNEFSN